MLRKIVKKDVWKNESKRERERERERRNPGQGSTGFGSVALHIPAHLAGAGRGALSAISITNPGRLRIHVDTWTWTGSQTKFVLPYILGSRTHLPLKDWLLFPPSLPSSSSLSFSPFLCTYLFISRFLSFSSFYPSLCPKGAVPEVTDPSSLIKILSSERMKVQRRRFIGSLRAWEFDAIENRIISRNGMIEEYYLFKGTKLKDLF